MKRMAMAGTAHKPELEAVRVGFLPLNDCASLVIAAYAAGFRSPDTRLAPH